MPIRFDIDIDLFSVPGALHDPEAVQAAVEAGLAAMWPAFGLPAQPSVHVRWVEEMPDLFDFTMRLDGQPCSVPVYHPAHPSAPLSFRILSAIFYHRVRLITGEQLRQLRQQYLAETKTAATWSSAPLPVWHALATLLLRHGFSLDRLPQCFAHWSPEHSPEETFERLIENPEALTLTITANPALSEAAKWEAQLPGFYQEIYQERGILLPEITFEAAAELPFEQFRLRFNDLWLPVLAGLQTGESLFAGTDADSGVFVPSKDRFYTKNPPADDLSLLPELDDPQAYLLDWLKYWVGQLSGWYVNTGIVEGLLDQLEESNRSLIIMIREQWPAQRLCGLLRALLDEGVSIRNLSEILDVLLRIDGPLAVDDTEYLLYFTPASRVVTIPPGATVGEFSLEQRTTQVRAGLKFPIVFPHLVGGFLPCYNIDPPLLRDLRDGFFQQASPTPGSAFYQLLHSVRERTEADYPKPVLLVPTGIRPAVAGLLRPYFPQMAVVGHEEIPPFFIPQVKNTIQIGS